MRSVLQCTYPILCLQIQFTVQIGAKPVSRDLEEGREDLRPDGTIALVGRMYVR